MLRKMATRSMAKDALAATDSSFARVRKFDPKKGRRYVAGEDAKATYAMRLQTSDEAFRKAINQ
jgi:hypothetical protein